MDEGRLCGQSCRPTFNQVRRKRPNPAVHALDRMILHRSDSGHSFQVQQSHGSEGRLSGTFQTLRRGVAKVGT
jgi:hypothetical protein